MAYICEFDSLGLKRKDNELLVEWLEADGRTAAEIKYVKERTCRQVIIECNDGLMPPFTANCSECGIAWGYTPSYCPECHAKVIGD